MSIELNKDRPGFLIRLTVEQVGDRNSGRTESKVLENIHLIGDNRLPSAVITASVMTMLYKILEAKGGHLADSKCDLMLAWVADKEKKLLGNPEAKVGDDPAVENSEVPE